MQIPFALAELEDGIAHQLPGTVVGDVAAPLDFVKRRVADRQQVFAVRAAAGRDDVRVLDQEQRVRDLVLLPRHHQLALHRPHLAEVAGAEIDEPREIPRAGGGNSSRVLSIHRF